MSYFIRWYKTGVQPPIRVDTIYCFYRTQSKNRDVAVPPVKYKFGPLADVIYVTADLTAPATLRVESGGRVILISLRAGSHDVSAAFAVGEAPKFTLSRDGRAVLQGRAPTESRLPRSFHQRRAPVPGCIEGLGKTARTDDVAASAFQL